MAASKQLTRLSRRVVNPFTLSTRTFSTSPRVLSSSIPRESQPKTTYPFYPSVAALLHAYKISPETAAKIPASGPKGRLLKGDVLSYLGTIDKSYSSAQSARITKLEHLDLSDITIAAPPNAAPPAVKEEVKVEMEPHTEVVVSVRLDKVLDVQRRIQETLGVMLPLSTFLARATELANDDLPRTTGVAPTADELFNEVLGLNSIPSNTSRGSYTLQITALSTPGFGAKAPPMKKDVDIIDLLSGTSKSPAELRGVGAPLKSVMVGKSEGASTNVFSVSVKKGEEKRARVFLERMKTILQVEPGRLVL